MYRSQGPVSLRNGMVGGNRERPELLEAPSVASRGLRCRGHWIMPSHPGSHDVRRRSGHARSPPYPRLEPVSSLTRRSVVGSLFRYSARPHGDIDNRTNLGAGLGPVRASGWCEPSGEREVGDEFVAHGPRPRTRSRDWTGGASIASLTAPPTTFHRETSPGSG